MKNTILTFLLTASLFTFSCTNNNNDDLGTQQEIVTAGTWRVSLFTDSGNNETSDFNGYSFSFNQNGQLSATRAGQTTNGTWNINTSSNDFNINLGPKVDTNKPLGELTDDWEIISISTTEIKLKDDNSSSNEFLTFTKN